MKRSAGFKKILTMAAFDRKLIKLVINYHGENVAESKKQKAKISFLSVLCDNYFTFHRSPH